MKPSITSYRAGRVVGGAALLGAMFEIVDDAIFTQDATGSITSWSLAAERLFAFAVEEIVGQPTATLFADHAHTDLHAVLETVTAGDPVRRFETEARRKDGMPILISLSACSVPDDHDAAGTVLVVARDITEQRLAQATLAAVEARIREHEALAHLGSWLWDVGTDTVQWSDELHRIHGVDPLDFEGTFTSHLDTVHPDDRARVRSQMETSAATGRAFAAEYRVVRPDGSQHSVRARAQPTMDSRGKALGLQGITQDVTERS